MNRFFKILILLVLVGSFWSFPFLSSGQDAENQNPFGGIENEDRGDRPIPHESEFNPQRLLDLFIPPKENPQPESENISESEVENNINTIFDTKSMVQVPESIPKQNFDAADFDDPFYRVRGFQGNTEKVLQPGTTLDGIQFQNYGESDKFIEQFYRESGFSMDKVFDKIKYLEKKGGCYTCHQGIEEISSNHKFSCVRCHGGNRRARSLPKAHKGLVPNPSSMENAPRFCGKCHDSHVKKIGRSSMATAKRMINITRFGWGAQPADEMPYSLYPGEQEQPYPPSGEEHAVDGFLKNKCLRCHLDAPGPHRPGDYRATGCSSCHMIYTNDGVSLSHDRAIQSLQKKDKNRFERKFANKSLSNRRGYPLLHKFTTAIPSIQCEHCHNNNGVGEEYEGLFAKPDRPRTAPKSISDKKPVLYGKEHEFLVPDIHREKGMHCIDCHIGDEMKPEVEPEALRSAVQIRCIDCHGTASKKPEGILLIESDANTKKLLKKINLNPNLNNKIRTGDTVLVNSNFSPMMHIKQAKDKWVLYSKVTGKKHTIPLLKNIDPSIAHQIPKHMDEMECSACHARWSAAEWGMHLIRENSFAPEKWKDWDLADPDLQEQLSGRKAEGTINWLSAKSRPNNIEGNRLPGYWWSVFSETGWSDLIMGKNDRGKYSILKPRYQYFITDRTSPLGVPTKRAEPPLTLDGGAGLIWTAYSPHTIRKTVRSCESCHQNKLSSGLGDPLRQSIDDTTSFFDELRFNNQVLPQFQLKQGVTQNGEPLQTPFPTGEIRFLNAEEITALQETTDRFRAYRFLNLRELSFPRLLSRQEFPYDIRHRAQENLMGPPSLKDDLYYDVEKNKFVKSAPEIPVIDKPQIQDEPSISETVPHQETIPQESGTPEEEHRGKNNIIEFLYDIFQTDETQQPEHNEPPLEP
ncbi:MAG: cytochrome c3 family protein [Nitrospina sp.]|nr:cytochrome c3 family protein [Nitrospina sp.]